MCALGNRVLVNANYMFLTTHSLNYLIFALCVCVCVLFVHSHTYVWVYAVKLFCVTFYSTVQKTFCHTKHKKYVSWGFCGKSLIHFVTINIMPGGSYTSESECVHEL